MNKTTKIIVGATALLLLYWFVLKPMLDKQNSLKDTDQIQVFRLDGKNIMNTTFGKFKAQIAKEGLSINDKSLFVIKGNKITVLKEGS